MPKIDAPPSDQQISEEEFNELQSTAAPKPPAAKPKKGQVIARVMKLGHNKIFTGETDVSGPIKFQQGDRFPIDRSIAEEHENKGWVEIL